MNQQLQSARVMTVLGPVSVLDLGVTLPHEHVFLDLSCWWSHPNSKERECLIDAPVSEIDRELLVADPYHTRDNLILDNEELAVAELGLFKQSGGGSIIDLTTRTIGPYPAKLKDIALRTGLNIIAATGYYVKRAHGSHVGDSSAEQLAEVMIKELTEGIDDTGVRAGIIGEIGTSSPVHPDESKVLRAAALAHEQSGAAINVHMTIFEREGNNVLDLLENSGVDPRFVALSHLDELPDQQYHTSLAKRGCFIEFDCFGSECRFDEHNLVEPTDVERTEALLRLLDLGYEKQLLISQDVCTKMQLRRYGGNGYDHIMKTIVPHLRQRGVPETTLRTILVENPARLLLGKRACQSEFLRQSPPVEQSA